MNRVLLIDNYDSFSHILAHVLGGARVVRNDAITVREIEELAPTHIVISPGPGRPEDAGISVDVLRAFAGRVPILGVCLGHQALATAFGGRVERAPTVMHGKASRVMHDGRGVFEGIDDGFVAGRYHSLVIPTDGVPEGFEVCARTSNHGTIMGIRHREWPVHGVQFHPESVLTPEGKAMLGNFVGRAGAPVG